MAVPLAQECVPLLQLLLTRQSSVQRFIGLYDVQLLVMGFRHNLPQDSPRVAFEFPQLLYDRDQETQFAVVLAVEPAGARQRVLGLKEVRVWSVVEDDDVLDRPA